MRRLLSGGVGVFALAAVAVAAYGVNVEAEEAAFAKVAAASQPDQPTKQLHTIPEDGLDDGEAPGVTKLVRSTLAARPNEDLVICVAGCFSGRDRIVYAQPSNRTIASPPTEAGYRASSPTIAN